MNKGIRKPKNGRLVVVMFFAIFVLIATSARMAQTEAEFDHFIVQGTDMMAVETAVTQVGGTVERQLTVINAVAATIPVAQLSTLEQMPTVSRVWADVGVQSSSTPSDPLLAWPTSVSVMEEEEENLDVDTILTCEDGSHAEMHELPRKHVRPDTYMAFTFDPTFDIANVNGSINLNFHFNPRRLRRAELSIYQASTDSWHNTSLHVRYVNGNTAVSVDVSNILVTDEDLDNLEVRFYASGREVDVDCINLQVPAVQQLGGDEAAVWEAGNTGWEIGIAVIDSGVTPLYPLTYNTQYDYHYPGLKEGWNAIKNEPIGYDDKNGHGTIIGSIISNQEINPDNNYYYGIAPDSYIIPVQALNNLGRGKYSDIIAAIEWIIANKDVHNIRIINLSLSAQVKSHYWDDPLNQAVMKAWQEGIVVIAAAGNRGPDPMSVGVPGNNPYIITVGAITDSYTPDDRNDDRVTIFSSAGPTHEGFVKPDVVAPGSHIVGIIDDGSDLSSKQQNNIVRKNERLETYYALSGTSMSAAYVSGTVALMLAENPELTPDEVKYRLMASAQTAVNEDGTLAFS
ncbi:MAG: S8 family peptidase, partial [Chloroflexi bacterium]|nr:S8 family peptidase [Chloroflexota bacterium]